MEALAKFKNCPVAPRKVRLVADNVRGKAVDKAFDILKFTRKEGAYWIEKTLNSAVANWTQKANVSPDEFGLVVKEIRIDAGMTLKRFQPAPHGRAHRVRKRHNHIVIIVENTTPVQESTDNGDDQ